MPSRIYARTVSMSMGAVAPATAVLNPVFSEGGCNATVQIGIDQSSASLAANGPPNLRATIAWQVSGVSVQRIVSVGQGTSVTGVGEGVSVSLQDVTGTPKDASVADYEVTVSVSPGVRASTSMPPTLIPLNSEATYEGPNLPYAPPTPGTYTLKANENVKIAVPPGSGATSVFVQPGLIIPGFTPPGAGYFYILQYDINDTVLSLYVPDIDTGFIPLSPLCTQINIVNTSNAAIVGIHVAWGIDG